VGVGSAERNRWLCEVKAFGIRVAIVEPGVIATNYLRQDESLGGIVSIRTAAGWMSFFHASLQNPVSAYVVGEVIRDLLASDSPQLRYPVGPDAAPILASRARVTDEEWIASQTVSDEEWAARSANPSGSKSSSR
jgi:NAD(P)-dependent dehydrogenase (short-subunit alcohol dehydrogenase family)